MGNRDGEAEGGTATFPGTSAVLLLLSEVNPPVGLPDIRDLEEIRQKVAHPDRNGMLDLNLLFKNTVRFLLYLAFIWKR